MDVALQKLWFDTFTQVFGTTCSMTSDAFQASGLDDAITCT
jgi:hypothetical protein